MVNLVLPKVSWGFLQDLVCICCPKPVRDQVKGINHILLFTAFNDNSFLFINPLTQPILPSTSVSIKLKITVCFCHKCGLWVINKWFPWQLVFQHVHLLKQALGLLKFVFFSFPPCPIPAKVLVERTQVNTPLPKKAISTSPVTSRSVRKALGNVNKTEGVTSKMDKIKQKNQPCTVNKVSTTHLCWGGGEIHNLPAVVA